MERFKACEKEIKTKAFSKEGLTTIRLNPRDKEKMETCSFVQNMLEELQRQIEVDEAQIVTIQGSMKKGKRQDAHKVSQINDLNEHLERLKWHQGKLELVLRFLENGDLQPDQVNSIQEDIKYFVESNQDPDFAEDDEIYEELGLDMEDDLAAEIEKDAPLLPIQEEEENESRHERENSIVSSTSDTKKIFTSFSKTKVVPAISSTGNILNLQPVTAPPIGELKYASAAAGPHASNIDNVPTSISTIDGTTSSSSPEHKNIPPIGLNPLPPPSNVLNIVNEVTNTPTNTISTPEMISSPDISSSTATTSRTNSVWSSTIIGNVKTDTLETPKRDSEYNLKANSQTFFSSSGQSRSNSVTPIPDLINHHNRLPPGLQMFAGSLNAAKDRLENPPPISEIRALLESSMINCPSSFDADMQQRYTPLNEFPTLDCYPTNPLVGTDKRVVMRADTDVLFYMFYYRQGKYVQHLAAEELKNRGWLYFKEDKRWYKRGKDGQGQNINDLTIQHPRSIINKDNKNSNPLLYFDFDRKWEEEESSRIFIDETGFS